tara:strand:- start:142 stop:339 length:198 start_codon:yes stop_codon:yes gene_type:complete
MAIKKTIFRVHKINLINVEKNKIGKKQLVKNNPKKKVYGLSILEDIIQLQCRKNMNLDYLWLQVN